MVLSGIRISGMLMRKLFLTHSKPIFANGRGCVSTGLVEHRRLSILTQIWFVLGVIRKVVAGCLGTLRMPML